MSQHRKHRGYKTQRNVAEYLKEWWPNAYSIGAGAQGSDIQAVPFDVEVKAVTNLSIPALLRQIKARTAGLGFGVARLNGQGDNAAEYAAILRFEDLVNLLIKAGYNNIQKTEPTRCDKCGSWMILGLVCETCRIMTFNA